MKTRTVQAFKSIIIAVLIVLMILPCVLCQGFTAKANDETLSLLRFYEVGVGTDAHTLSVYVHNPAGLSVKDDERNKIQLAYANDETHVFSADFAKYPLKITEKSDNSTYILFEICDFKAQSDDVRFYAISGIELYVAGSVQEFAVAQVFKAQTVDGETTLETQTLDTLNVDVKHTFYRSGFSEKNFKVEIGDGVISQSKGWSNQVSSCYFALPKNFSAGGMTGGTLEALTAEFENYHTRPMIITKTQDDFNAYNNVLHQDMRGQDVDTLRFIAGAGDKATSIFCYSGNTDDLTTYARYGFSELKWLFKTDENADFNSEDFLFKGENVKDYYYDYVEQYGAEQAKDLFYSAEQYDEYELDLSGFDYGYNKHTYSIAQEPEEGDDVLSFNLLADRGGNTNFWSAIFNCAESETKTLAPLVKIDKNDLSLTDAEFSQKYYVDKNEIADLKIYAAEQIEQGKDVWLFRYDVCEYFGTPARNPNFNETSERDVYVAQQSVYLNFDILSFRFAQDDLKYTIANVASPEDVFNDITTPPQAKGFWTRLWDTISGFFVDTAPWWLISIGGIILIIATIFIIKALVGVVNGGASKGVKILEITLLIILWCALACGLAVGICAILGVV